MRSTACLPARFGEFARLGSRAGAHFLQGGNGCICDVNPWVRRVHAAHLVRVGLRRLNYIAHWLAYAVAHKTTRHAAWACAHKGVKW